MGVGIAKVHEKPIPEQLGNMSIIALDDLGTDPLVCTDHVPVLFGIELGGELGGVHQVTEHHRELPSFRLRSLKSLLCLGSRLWCCPSRGSGDFLGITDPDKDSLILLHCQFLSIDQLVLQVFQGLVIESELSFHKAIGQPFPLSEQRDNLVEDVVQAHSRLLSSAWSSAFASIRSAVSNPSVNQLYTGASNSYASWRLPCCCHKRARLVAVRNSRDLACWLWAIAMAWRKQDSASVA